MIQVDRLTKKYSGKKIPSVNAISFTVQQGDVFGFLGPNGAGKTTTVKMLMGLIRPTSGTISLLGATPDDVGAKQRIGFLPEHPYFYQYLTAREFLTMCAQIFALPAAEISERITQVLQMVHLEKEAWDRRVHTYSKGMQQRLGLAQALINDPDLVVLDEPMSGLDPLGRREVKDLILMLKKQGKTIFVNSHILTDVEDLCNRIALIDGGNMLLTGDISTITKNKTQSLESVFLHTISAHRV